MQPKDRLSKTEAASGTSVRFEVPMADRPRASILVV